MATNIRFRTDRKKSEYPDPVVGVRFEIAAYAADNIEIQYKIRTDNGKNIGCCSVYSHEISDINTVKKITIYLDEGQVILRIDGGKGAKRDTSERKNYTPKTSILIPLKDKTGAKRFFKALQHFYSFQENCNPYFKNSLELENKF